MKECCQWWSAIKSLRRVESARDDWAMAADRCQRTHCKRLSKPPKRNKQRNVDSWYGASRRLLSGHLTKFQHATDAWVPAILSAIVKRHKSDRKRTISLVCSKCRKCQANERRAEQAPKWIMRCIRTHKQRISSASRTDWQRKADAIACGLRSRTKGSSRKVLPKVSNWADGITQAVTAFNAKRSRANASEWSKWSVNVASNNRKRQRGKQHRKAQRQSDKQGNLAVG